MQNDPVAPGAPSSHNHDIETQRRQSMQMVMISREDMTQVRAILETHAEMQDQRTVENLELISTINVQEPDDDEARSMVRDLTDQNETFEGDTDNLRRIAKIFM